MVVLGGLQSEAGQRLNGGHGLVLSDKPTKDGRYPVRIFAISKTQLPPPPPAAADATIDDGSDEPIILDASKLKLLEDPDDKTLKIHNLSLHPSPETNKTFLEGGKKCIRRAEQRKDYNAVFFLSTAYFKAFPDEYGAAIVGVSNYGHVKQDYKTASDTIYKIFHESPVLEKTDDPRYGDYLFEAVRTYVSAKEHLEDASDYAHLIPTNTFKDARLAIHAFQLLINVTDQMLRDRGNWGEQQALLAKIRLRAVQTVYDLNQNDPGAEFELSKMLAGAYYWAGEYWDSVKMYRRTLKRHGVPAGMRGSLAKSLIEAQMHCPGMPLEDYTVVGHCPNGQLACARNDDAANIRSNSGGGNAFVYNTMGDMTLKMIQPPTDPDDEMFAPLLEKLKLEDGM